MNVKEKKEKEEQGAVTSSPRLACPLLSDTVDMVEHSLARDSSQLLLSSGVVVYNLVSVLSTVQCVNCHYKCQTCVTEGAGRGVRRAGGGVRGVPGVGLRSRRKGEGGRLQEAASIKL